MPHIRTKTVTKSSAVAAAVAGVVASSVWLQTHPVSAACAAPAKSYGTATLDVTVPANGTYRLWSRVMAPDATNNAFMIEVDGDSCYTVGNSAITAGVWTWVDYQNATSATKINASLTPGKHTVKFIGTEPGVKVDRVLAVTDTACVPSGTGDNCAVAGDTTSPVATVTAPADGAAVQGTVAVNATATDDKGVAKVEFYVDNVLKNTATVLPYTYSWNTAGLSNGSHTVTVKAYDAAGNVGIDSNVVTVGNGDTQAPTVPGNVKATANAASKVTLTWNASTDNTAVTGYVITRNGAPLESIGTVTMYADEGVLPGTAYTYKVSARDAAGNTSVASAAATVTTPALADTQAPGIPGNVQATAAGTSQINVSWNASTDNVGISMYDVYRVSGPNTQKVGSTDKTKTQFGDTGLSASTNYGYYIVARDAAGNSSQQSLTASATTAAVPTTPPADATTGIVRGKVTGSGRRPITNVKVTIWSDKKRFQATTNSEGIYRFENIPAGRYRIQFKADSYYTEEDTLRVRDANDVVIENMRLTARGERNWWWSRWW